MTTLVFAAAAVLSGFALAQAPQTPPAQTPQPQDPRPRIEIPPDLPPPAGEEMRIKPGDIDALLADGKVVLLDVREPWEIEESGTREGSINIPLGQLEKRLGELPKDKAILTA